jgi:hypothetical protein
VCIAYRTTDTRIDATPATYIERASKIRSDALIVTTRPTRNKVVAPHRRLRTARQNISCAEG